MSKVILVYRKPYNSAYSIEYLFNSIHEEIKKKKTVDKYILPYFSKGIKSFIFNILSLTRFKKDVVHITGDVYYAILGAVFCKRIITIHDLSFLSRTTGVKRRILKFFWISLPVKYSDKVTVV